MFSRRQLMELAASSAAAAACRREDVAREARVAAAANVSDVLARIADEYRKQTEHGIAISTGSSGKLYAQIKNGAPFHVFLSADAERPARLEAEGLAVRGTRFTYALGRLALVGPKLEHPHDGTLDLRAHRYTRLAIANPNTAPYGAAALELLRNLGLDELEPRLVRGENVAQALQFVDSGAAELGLVAFSNVISRSELPCWKVPQELHAPIRQDAVLLRAGESLPAATEFIGFLRAEQARSLLAAAGYDVPLEA